MEENFDNKCPYCGSNNITFIGQVSDTKIAYNAEEYVCDGKCQRSFYVQHCDGNLIMHPTMNSKYLLPNSLAFAEKNYFEKIAIEENVDLNLPICGNCVSYEWGKNYEEKYDRHYGSCYFQNKNINYTISDAFIKGKLHSLTNASSCDCFFNFRKK